MNPAAQQTVAPTLAATVYCGMTTERLADAVLAALEALRDSPVSLRELSREAGLTPSTVTRLLDGEYNVTDRHAEAIEGALMRLAARYVAAAGEMAKQARLIRRAQRKGGKR